jgi:transcription antitermination factor NusG
MWFAVMCHPQKERAAAREIEAIGLGEFYPWVKVRRNRRRGRQVITEWIEQPYYPRYLFADCRLDDVHRVNDIRHVSRVVAFGGKPAAIPDGVMTVIRAGANAEGLMGSKDEVARKRFEAASQVKFVPGSPMHGVIVRILRDDGQRDVTVLVAMLGGDRELKVPATSLELVA